jgi:hypothetical protein
MKKRGCFPAGNDKMERRDVNRKQLCIIKRAGGENEKKRREERVKWRREESRCGPAVTRERRRAAHSPLLRGWRSCSAAVRTW